MSLQSQLYTLLSTGATLAGSRVFPLGAPEDTARPYIVYQRISTNAENIMAGSSGLANSRLQLDAYADSYASAVTLAEQIDTLMNGWSVPNVSVLVSDFYEDDVKIFRISQDFSVWHDW